ncbi:ribbon-helix-helix domain-containing protein [Serratia fonticola]|uniref:ribbon-helix-helix domain-containing protein n=1 Tax=Serratia fonticola TaxID=47917 RepID=UPI0021B73620|nr:ribbon-helix-helix domain-containing protein [Serratia fonticola]
MVSKNRISVNFSSHEMVDKIKAIKKETGKSVSKIIEELIEFRLLKYDRTSSVRKIINHARYMKDKVKVSDLNYKVALKKPGFKNGISFGGGHGDVYGITDVYIPKKLIDIFDSSDFAQNEIKKRVRSKIKEEIRSMSFAEWERGCFSHLGMPGASYFLILIEKVSVTLLKIGEPHETDRDGYSNGSLCIEYTAKNVYGMPFVFGEDTPVQSHELLPVQSHTLAPYLDFNRVCYKTFADYAQNGWNRSKHSHLVYIERATKSTKGGFFIGVLYNKNRQLSDKAKKKRGILGTEVKVCFAHDFLTIEKVCSLTGESVRESLRKDLYKELEKSRIRRELMKQGGN